MTKKELYTKMYEHFNAFAIDDEFAQEAVALCKKEIAAIDASAARNAEKRAEKNAENAPFYEQILEFIGADARTASEVAPVLGVNVQKASSLLRQLVAEGKLTVTDVKVKGKGTQKAYAIAE